MLFAVYVLTVAFNIQFQEAFSHPSSLLQINNTRVDARLRKLRELHQPIVRVVGGHTIPEDRHPHLAILVTEDLVCGGSLISELFVLTAAHCFEEGMDLKEVKVYLGVHNRIYLDDGEHAQKFSIEKLISHEKYSDIPGGSVDNDIALIRLDRGATFTDYVKPICLPKVGGTFPVKKADVQGWGTTRYKGPTSFVPLKGTLNVLTTEECLNTSMTLKILGDPKTHICAYEYLVDACTGDSGGPLFTTTGKKILLGIVSTGRGCAEPGYPGIYTKVEAFQDWIDKHTVGSPPCKL